MLPTPQRRKPKQGEFLRAARPSTFAMGSFKTSGESARSNPQEASGSTTCKGAEQKGAAGENMRLGDGWWENFRLSSLILQHHGEVQSHQTSPVHVQFCWWACPVKSAITVMPSVMISVDSRFTGQEAACLGSLLG